MKAQFLYSHRLRMIPNGSVTGNEMLISLTVIEERIG
jgi:hypothetical protein